MVRSRHSHQDLIKDEDGNFGGPGMTFHDDELRHTARLWRALLDRFLGEVAPPEPSGPTVLSTVEEHLGVSPLSLPVVTERWAPHEHADVQLALERWIQDSGSAAVIVGTSHHARRHQTFVEL